MYIRECGRMIDFGQRVKKMWKNIYEIKKKKDEK
jgi:hypothetical protein